MIRRRCRRKGVKFLSLCQLSVYFLPSLRARPRASLQRRVDLRRAARQPDCCIQALQAALPLRGGQSLDYGLPSLPWRSHALPEETKRQLHVFLGCARANVSADIRVQRNREGIKRPLCMPEPAPPQYMRVTWTTLLQAKVWLQPTGNACAQSHRQCMRTSCRPYQGAQCTGRAGVPHGAKDIAGATRLLSTHARTERTEAQRGSLLLSTNEVSIVLG